MTLVPVVSLNIIMHYASPVVGFALYNVSRYLGLPAVLVSQNLSQFWRYPAASRRIKNSSGFNIKCSQYTIINILLCYSLRLIVLSVTTRTSTAENFYLFVFLTHDNPNDQISMTLLKHDTLK